MQSHSDADLDPGAVVGPYQIVRTLGVGAMGAVYEATHARHGERVALKVLHADLAASEEVRTRFVREGRHATQVRHPHVAEVRGVGESYGRHYLVLEYLEGESLEERITRAGRFDVAPLVALALPVCAALAAVHAAGIVHRDIKPANVFLARGPDGAIEPKVLDFGISKATRSQSAEITAASTTLGTPQYMSPEQTRGARHVDARTDQYALGVLLYECSTGRLPFDADEVYSLMVAVHRGEFQPPRAVRPDLPAAFEAVVLRAMARDADARFPGVISLGQALLPFATEATRARWALEFNAGSHDAPTLRPPAPDTGDGGDPGDLADADIDLGASSTLRGDDLAAALGESPRPPGDTPRGSRETPPIATPIAPPRAPERSTATTRS